MGGKFVRRSSWTRYEEFEPEFLRLEGQSPAKGEVLEAVVVGEIAETRHPDISSDENADGIVDFLGFKVVVQEEQHLAGPPQQASVNVLPGTEGYHEAKPQAPCQAPSWES